MPVGIPNPCGGREVQVPTWAEFEALRLEVERLRANQVRETDGMGYTGERWERIIGRATQPTLVEAVRFENSVVLTIDLPGGALGIQVFEDKVQWSLRMGAVRVDECLDIEEEADHE